MAPHSSTFAWKIPWTEEPGGPKKDVLFIIGDWNAKVGSQEAPGVTGKFGLGIRNEAGQRLIQFCQENALVIAEWSSGFPYFLQFKSEFGNKEFMI